MEMLVTATRLGAFTSIGPVLNALLLSGLPAICRPEGRENRFIINPGIANSVIEMLGWDVSSAMNSFANVGFRRSAR